MITTILLAYIALGFTILLIALMQEHGWEFSLYLTLVFLWLPCYLFYGLNKLVYLWVKRKYRKVCLDPEIFHTMLFMNGCLNTFNVKSREMAMYRFALCRRKKLLDVAHNMAIIYDDDYNRKKKIKQMATGSTLE